MPKLDPKIKRLLEEAGTTYEITRSSKHHQLRIGGRLVLVLPHDYRDGSPFTQRNALCAVRRHLRSLVNA